MTARFFTLDYAEHATLRDGTRVRIRLVRPSDKETLRAGFDRLSPAARYTRFLSCKTSLSEDELRYLSEVDHEDHFAIGAVLDRDDDPAEGTAATPVGLGVARFIRLPDRPDTAEAAIAVADEAQHKCLGKLLFLRLAAAAAERGVERFRCEVLAENASMTALLAQIAPERTIEVGGGVMSIEFALPGVAPTEPPSTAELHGPIYRLFRAAAQNAIEWTEAVRTLWRK
jgi:GNAT superfamily N-acetyltransferase